MPVNTLINSNIVTKESIFQYSNMPALAKFASTKFSEKFGKTQQIGTTMSIRRPVVVTASNNGSWAYAAKQTLDTSVVLSLTSPITYTPYLTDVDQAFRIEDFKTRYAKNWMLSIVNQVDTLIADAISNAGANIVVSGESSGNPQFSGATSVSSYMPLQATGLLGGTQSGGQWLVYASGGTNAATAAVLTQDILKANQLLDDAGIGGDRSERISILTPQHQTQLLSQAAVLTNNYKQLEAGQKTGLLTSLWGVDFYSSPNLASHVMGSAWNASVTTTSAAGLASGWAETGTVALTGLTASSTIRIGDVITFGSAARTNAYANGNPNVDVLATDVGAVNPLNHTPQANVQQFTVVGVGSATNITSVTGGVITLGAATTATLVVSPAPIYGGDYQNITRQIANGEKAYLFGTAGAVQKESVLMVPEAIELAVPELPTYPKGYGADQAWARDPDTGLGLRTTFQFDGMGVAPGATGNVGVAIRMDLLLGVKIVKPDGIVRIRSI